jgi:hemerythrin
MADSAQTPELLGAWLSADHDEIERLLANLIDAFETGDRDIAAAAYRDVERHLSAHFAIEDDVLLPELSRAYPDEARALAEEHQAIRLKVDELGIGVDLHATRAPAIRELVDMLRAHAHREDSLLYRWVDHAADEPALRARIENALMPRGRSPAPPTT